MASFGDARVSTAGQDLAIQQEALRAAGCVTIRSAKKSGGDRGARPELRTLLDFCARAIRWSSPGSIGSRARSRICRTSSTS